MIKYDYEIRNGYDLFVVEWPKNAPEITKELPVYVKTVEITKEGLVFIHFQTYDGIKYKISKEDLLKTLIQYLPEHLLEVNRKGEVIATVKWIPKGTQGTMVASFKTDNSGEYQLTFLCKSITKEFIK